MAQTPVNTRLWNMLVVQAKSRFRVYPSLPASHWVHTQYVRHGGQFTDSAKKDDRHKGGKVTAQSRLEDRLHSKEDKDRDAKGKGRKG